MRDRTCVGCGFVGSTPIDAVARGVGLGRRCDPCLLAALGRGATCDEADVERARSRCVAVALPPTTQAFASILGRTALACARLVASSRDDRRPPTPAASRIAGGAGLLLRSVAGREAIPDRDLLWMQVSATDAEIDSWFEAGTLSDLDFPALERMAG